MKYKLIELILILSLLSFSCRNVRYSFTGVTIPPEIQSISIHYFPNQALIVQPTLSQVFTESLKNKFISQTRLLLVNDDGDMNLEGAITGYDTKPVAVQGNETAAMTRLTISVRVNFTNSKIENQSFEKTFSAYTNFDSNKNINDIEDELIQDIVAQLTEDIFNEALINW
ncbi:MAG: LptE family protein [Bacteroidia bacterium]|nr:LptE family protein [Bacteroidia bacterium]